MIDRLVTVVGILTLMMLCAFVIEWLGDLGAAVLLDRQVRRDKRTEQARRWENLDDLTRQRVCIALRPPADRRAPARWE